MTLKAVRGNPIRAVKAIVVGAFHLSVPGIRAVAPLLPLVVQARGTAKAVIEQQLAAVEQQLQASKYLVRHSSCSGLFLLSGS